MPKPANYFPALDGLRLLASVNIVMLHLASSNALQYMGDCRWLMRIIDAPAFAAGIFFVLAGFLFASKFVDPNRRTPVVSFMFGRISKLYRLHFITTLLMFVVLVFKFSGYSHLPGFSEIGDCFSAGLAKMVHPWRSLIMHLTLTWSIVPDLGMKLNEPSWSLTSFFVCYAITPAFSSWLFRRSNFTLWVLFGALFVPGAIWAAVFGLSGNWWFDSFEAKYRFFHMFPLARVPEYMFGMVIYRLYSDGKFDFLKKGYVSGIMQAVLLVGLYVSMLFLKTPYVGWNYFCHHSIPILIYGLFLLCLATGKGFMSRFFCISIVRRIGRASFYPYLIHLPLISIAWGICNLNSPRNTLLFMLFVYTISTLYMEFKVWRKKKRVGGR
ncbi:MAG: acyltransferase [Fibrobacteraceae bacterium]|nr:acyltransferase [Fibrobacteraceae bacterium]